MIELYNGDCLEVMDRLIQDGVKVDAIITDPPYGTTACKWDSVIPFDAMWERLKLLRKDDTSVILFGSEPFSSALRMSNIKEYKYDWVWEKHAPSNFATANKMPMKYHEIISVFFKKQPKYNKQMILRTGSGGQRVKYKHSRTSSEHITLNKNNVEYDENYKNPSSVLKFNGVYKNTILHPTQKPVDLLEYLIKTYTNEGDVVLDFTMGSGTTGVACVNTNRNFIGIELDEKYFNIAKERIEKAQLEVHID